MQHWKHLRIWLTVAAREANGDVTAGQTEGTDYGTLSEAIQVKINTLAGSAAGSVTEARDAENAVGSDLSTATGELATK